MNNKIVSRAYNKFTKNEVKNTITKISSNDKLCDEIEYYNHIQRDYPQYLDYFVNVHSYSVNRGEISWIEMTYYDCLTLGDHLVSDDLPVSEWKQILHNLHKILDNWSKNGVVTQDTYAKEMYIDKTFTEYNKFFHNNYTTLTDLLVPSELVINEITYLNFTQIWTDVKQYIETNLMKYDTTLIHGDLCFSNVLYFENNFKFIDPRGSFGKLGVVGDSKYDIAKLYHSVDGAYEFIINDKFTIHNTNNIYTVYVPQNLTLLSMFEDVFFPSAYFKKQIKIMEGLLYIGMCDRHFDSKLRQQVMYITGIKLLNEGLAL